MDSCYLCEIGKEGLIVPHPFFKGRQFLICAECLLSWIYQHPRLAAFTTAKEPTTK